MVQSYCVASRSTINCTSLLERELILHPNPAPEPIKSSTSIQNVNILLSRYPIFFQKMRIMKKLFHNPTHCFPNPRNNHCTTVTQPFSNHPKTATIQTSKPPKLQSHLNPKAVPKPSKSQNPSKPTFCDVQQNFEIMKAHVRRKSMITW